MSKSTLMKNKKGLKLRKGDDEPIGLITNQMKREQKIDKYQKG